MINEELKSALIRFRDLLQIARDHKIDKYEKCYWSLFAIENFFLNESKRIATEYFTKVIKTSTSDESCLYECIAKTYNYFENITDYLKTRKGEILLNEPILQQSPFWTVEVYFHTYNIINDGLEQVFKK